MVIRSVATLKKRKLQVFISSTYTDLLGDRQAAVGEILKSGHIPAGMELFTAGDKSQLEIIKRWIDESDIFMLILGGRYGSLEPESGLSYTEIEYNYAISKQKPFFAVVINPEALEQRNRLNGSNVLELKEPHKLEEFRGKVTSRMCEFYSDAKDIKLAVHNAISFLEEQHFLLGWVHASQVPDTTGLIDQINRITEENRNLLARLEMAKKVPLARAAQNQIGRDELLPIIRVLLRESVEPPERAHREHVVEVEHIFRLMREFTPFLKKEFPEFKRITRTSELSLFYVIAPKLVKGGQGFGHYTFEVELLEYCGPRWVLDDLVKRSSRGIYEIAPTGKKLVRWLSNRYREAKGQSFANT